MKKLLIYAKSVYHIPQKIKELTDKRARKTIPFFNLIMPVFLFLLLQYESFHTVFSSPESMRKRLKHCIRGRIPKVDAIRDALGLTDPEETEGILTATVSRIQKNAVLRGGTIGGYVTAAIDGVELFCSRKKKCGKCLTRKTASGEMEYFHKSIVCTTVGSNPHLILGQDMLDPRDGAEKDEGELTGGKRLIETLYSQHGHFADVIVADGLYLNVPFLRVVLKCHMEAVIRLKDERRLIFQDAEKLFGSGEGKKEPFYREGKKIDCWDLDGFELEGLTDSKKLTEKKREKFYEYLINNIPYGIGIVDAKTIDEINIYEASREAMKIAIKNLRKKIPLDIVLTDAMPIDLDIDVRPIIKGDAKSLTIAAASVIAKVTRDHMLYEVDKVHPEYGFKNHKGYPTKSHLEAINKYGLIDGYRLTYGPIKKYKEEGKC